MPVPNSTEPFRISDQLVTGVPLVLCPGASGAGRRIWREVSRLSIGLALLPNLGCVTENTKMRDATTMAKRAEPEIDSTLGERAYPNETGIAKQLAATIETVVRRDYQDRTALRDAHPKAHGCVRAEFRVMDGLPQELAKGIFISGHTYQAWMRFSNGSSDATRADAKRDACGVAIKGLGVLGRKLLIAEENATTQAFIMINHPVFFATDPNRYLSFMQDAGSPDPLRKLLLPFDLGAKSTMIALETRRSRITNPLEARYWSMVPYQLGTGTGRQVVRYSLRGCSTQSDSM